jgi:phosphohistidine phosphatase
VQRSHTSNQPDNSLQYQLVTLTSRPQRETRFGVCRRGESLEGRAGKLRRQSIVISVDHDNVVGVHVYLMRHGEAADAWRDAERPLTAHGRAQASSSAHALARLGVAPSVIWHSPYKRAAETAAIVASILHGELVVDDRFTPDADPLVAARAILAERRAVVVVAHLPILPSVVTVLCGGPCSFTTAGVAHLDVVGGAASLVGVYSASTLELLR